MTVCGAKTRNGKECKNRSMTNGRCRMHGGKSTGAPPEKMKGNRNAVKWGFWSKHVTPEQLEIMRDIAQDEPIDILWSNILLSFSAIIRAQRLMFVVDKDDHSDFQTKLSNSDTSSMEEHERVWSFEKHANFMQAQARAQSELRSLIKDFLVMSDDSDMRRLKLKQMEKEIELKNIEIERLHNPDGVETEDDGFLEALEGKAPEVWNDGEE